LPTTIDGCPAGSALVNTDVAPGTLSTATICRSSARSTVVSGSADQRSANPRLSRNTQGIANIAAASSKALALAGFSTPSPTGQTIGRPGAEEVEHTADLRVPGWMDEAGARRARPHREAAAHPSRCPRG
jgi:hypothetical protein